MKGLQKPAAGAMQRIGGKLAHGAPLLGMAMHRLRGSGSSCTPSCAALSRSAEGRPFQGESL